MRTRKAGTALAAAVALAAVALPAAPAAADAPIEFATTVNGDAADVYAPAPGDIKADLPVALLLQGANVDKSNYAAYARAVAGYGFVVVVPNHQRVIFGQPGLYAEEAQAAWTVTWMKQEDARTGSPLKGKIDTGSLVLLGHSFGGAAGLTLTTGACVAPFCDTPTTKPAELKGGAFYGTNNLPPGGSVNPPVANTVPVALIQGTADGRATPAAAEGTYNAIQTPPKMLVSVTGANHYGITDTQAPAGALPDPSPQTVTQETSIKASARWSAMYLRTILGDVWSGVWLWGVGDAVDSSVTVQYVK
ncbi:Alpha/beta hydrolase family protein [Thermomonospora echinospora]|uniref:Alpha/beta hydrolase family protein n=1 Tax=Thermomonospora echinospora TaxID=1992 RepID=A0A1H6B1X6_9ACTN|nr:alpha/beta hydrolase [Thermomonospora echinospora]SEG54604.1 Alpha/beta hydrolase family protein [Thermomonospora echinospora]